MSRGSQTLWRPVLFCSLNLVNSGVLNLVHLLWFVPSFVDIDFNARINDFFFLSLSVLYYLNSWPVIFLHVMLKSVSKVSIVFMSTAEMSVSLIFFVCVVFFRHTLTYFYYFILLFNFIISITFKKKPPSTSLVPLGW